MKIEVAHGELLDKLTILEIKLAKGLPVERDYDYLFALAAPIVAKPGVAPLFRVLHSINEELWAIEDHKRACEREQSFTEGFIASARLVYILNDERARIKRLIDQFTGSEITEFKSHGDLKCDK